ncbi:MAG: restriction endonuclease subunit S [Chloroflexi bacterium]|nr:restriction endonuclease subunit S [Chloroflexota bacterium]
MSSSIFPTPYKLTREELLLSSAATVIFKTLLDSGRENLSVSDICEHPQYGYTASAETIANGPRFVRITDIKGGTINWDTVPYCTCDEPDNYLIKKGDILVARAGSIGKSFLVKDVPEIAVFASYMIRLRARDGIMPNYVYWFFQSQQFWLQIESTHRGSAMSNINGKMLASLILPKSSFAEQQKISEFLGVFRRRLFGEKIELPELPSPMQDVRRIVAHIESLAARVNEAQRLRDEADKEAGNLLKATRNAIVEKLRNTYQTMALNDLCTKITDGPHVSPAYVSKAEGVAFISARNISETGYDFSTAQYVSRKDHEEFSKRVNIEKGDVLLIKVGATTGTARRVDIDIEFNIWVNVALLKLRQDIIIDAFMEHMLNAPSIKEHTLSMTFGSATPYIGLGKIGKIEMPVPPLDEQWRIVAYLDGLQAKVNVLRELQSQSQEELDALLPSVLDRAFKGEL